MHVIIVDTDRGAYVLCLDGLWAWTPLTNSLGGPQPKLFTRRKHAIQWLQTRPAGWWLTKPPGGRPRILSERTAGTGRG